MLILLPGRMKEIIRLSDSKGAVYISGNYSLELRGDDAAKGEIFGPFRTQSRNMFKLV